MEWSPRSPTRGFRSTWAPPTTTTAGSTSSFEECSDLGVCIYECNGDSICNETCIASASTTVQQTYLDIYSCIEASACVDASGNFDQVCAETSCGTQLDACFGPALTPSGDLSCEQFASCILECPETDDGSCYTACVLATSSEGYSELVSLSNCYDDAPCSSGDSDCYQSYCDAEITACTEL